MLLNVLRDVILATKNKGFLDLEIEGDSKIIMDCYNKKINPHSFIMLLMVDIWKLSLELNTYDCRHVIEKQIELLIV